MNKNSVNGMALANQNQFPNEPNNNNTTGDIYGQFCSNAIDIARGLDLADLSELDAVFNHAYFNGYRHD